MSKSYKENIRQHKKNNPCKTIRAQYEEQESEQDMRDYVGTSFLTIRKEDDDEDL
jgi:hypothetical protein